VARCYYYTLILLLLGLWSPAALALDAGTPLTEYHHDIWTGKDGAPGEITCMAQTRDGWLWLGTSNGLYRFDGMRFQRYEVPAGQTAPKRSITALTALRNGDLLIGYMHGGLSLLHQGRVSHFPANVGKKPMGPVFSAVYDEDGVLWAATTGGLLQLHDGAWRQVNAEYGLPSVNVSNLILDQYAQLWLASGDQLLVLARGAPRFRSVLSGIAAVNLSESPDGRLWLDTHKQLIPVPPQHQGPLLPRPDWLARAEGQESGLFDRDGNYWALGCPGVCRTDGVGLRPAAVISPLADADSRLDQSWQVSSMVGNLLFEDRDGNVWVATQVGLERLRNNRLLPVKLHGGERAVSLGRDADGHVLALAKPSGELWRLGRDGAVLLERQTQGPFGRLGTGSDGALLMARADHIERRLDGKIEIIDYPPDVVEPTGVPVTRIVDDGRALWVSIARHGTYRWQDHAWTRHDALGLPSGIAFSAQGDKGQMWFGYNDGLVVHYDQGRVTRYAPDDDNDVGTISFLAGGADVVAAGNGGLAVLKDGRFRRLNAADPDVLLQISGMVVSADGGHWFNGGKGVVYVSAADWRAAVAAPAAPLKYVLYGVLDGYPGFAATSMRVPTAISDADGQLWFVGVDGVARLDSRRVYPPPPPPVVKLENLTAQGRRYLDFSAPVVLAAGTTALRIEYTALSYSKPEALRFRYKLEGQDNDWQEAGPRRAVSYTNLAPGEYRFRVAASDQFRQGSEEDAVVAVHILPTFTQTPLFKALCALAALGGLYLLYLLYLRQVHQRIAARMEERERIARALHDSFLQSVQGLVLSFHSALSGLAGDSVTRQKIERVLTMADKVMEEGRNEVLDLRSGAMRDGDLGEGLALVGEVLQESRGGVFSMRTISPPRALDPGSACECYGIGREALMNAFRHAEAKTVYVELDYGAQQFCMLVRDDGKGIEPEVLEGGRRGHWGLTGFYERAARIGGQVTVDSRLGEGTCVSLTVPAECIYAGEPAWKRLVPRWLRRRFIR